VKKAAKSLTTATSTSAMSSTQTIVLEGDALSMGPISRASCEGIIRKRLRGPLIPCGPAALSPFYRQQFERKSLFVLAYSRNSHLKLSPV
jgi:hypothetical protein